VAVTVWGRDRLWQALALASCALFLASVARFYHPGFGFTALIVLTAGQEEYTLPALRDLPRYEYAPGVGYDGGYYVQLAMDPLLRDPAIDRALDAPAYRARRILFSWTAWALGMGRPAWILHVYSLQNVAAWLLLAWLLTRWLPPISARLFLLWFAVMFSHGLLASVRLSVLDGPSTLLLAAAVLAAERGRTWTAAGVVAVSGLGRETNLLGAAALPWPSGWRGWLRLAAACALVALPLLLWQDYLWSIYRGASASAGIGHITPPFQAYLVKWQVSLQEIRTHGFWGPPGWTAATLIALPTQALFLLAMARRFWREPWWRLALGYAALLFVVHYAVWEGYPGAVTRVVLPLTVGYNVLLAKCEGWSFWPWFVFGNLHVVAGVQALHVPGLAPPPI
jgi:hypothetical protein